MQCVDDLKWSPRASSCNQICVDDDAVLCYGDHSGEGTACFDCHCMPTCLSSKEPACNHPLIRSWNMHKHRHERQANRDSGAGWQGKRAVENVSTDGERVARNNWLQGLCTAEPAAQPDRRDVEERSGAKKKEYIQLEQIKWRQLSHLERSWSLKWPLDARAYSAIPTIRSFGRSFVFFFFFCLSVRAGNILRKM